MGRKPIQGREIKILVTDAQRQRIEALVGNYGVAGFIREAIDAALDRRERTEAARQRRGEGGDRDG